MTQDAFRTQVNVRLIEGLESLVKRTCFLLIKACNSTDETVKTEHVRSVCQSRTGSLCGEAGHGIQY